MRSDRRWSLRHAPGGRCGRWTAWCPPRCCSRSACRRLRVRDDETSRRRREKATRTVGRGRRSGAPSRIFVPSLATGSVPDPDTNNKKQKKMTKTELKTEAKEQSGGCGGWADGFWWAAPCLCRAGRRVRRGGTRRRRARATRPGPPPAATSHFHTADYDHRGRRQSYLFCTTSTSSA